MVRKVNDTACGGSNSLGRFMVRTRYKFNKLLTKHVASSPVQQSPCSHEGVRIFSQKGTKRVT